MTLLEIKSATITGKGQIAISKDSRKKLFKEGSKVAILTFNDKIEIRPFANLKKSFEKEGVQTALASERSLAKEWLKPEEDEAWKDL